MGRCQLVDLIIVRIVFVVVLSTCAYFLRPFQADGVTAALGGLVFGGAIILFERRVKQVSLRRLIGGAAGSVCAVGATPRCSWRMVRASLRRFLAGLAAR